MRRWVLVLLLVLPRLAGAEPEATEVRLDREDTRVVAGMDITPGFTETFRARVEGGLESRVEILTELRDREGAVVGRGLRSCKLLYSLWDERVYVSVRDEGRDQAQLSTFVEVDRAIAACGHIRKLPVALFGALTLAGGYRLNVRLVLNPVSDELVERSRQFVANPRGSGRGGSNAVLGTIAGLFSQEGGALGETLDFRSGALPRPVVQDPRRETSGGVMTATSGQAERRAP